MDLINQLSNQSPLVLALILAILIAAFFVLTSGTINAAAQKLLQRMPGGQKAAKSQDENRSPTLVAVGKLSEALSEIAGIFLPLATELKRTNNNTDLLTQLYKDRLQGDMDRQAELLGQFKANELAMKVRHDQIAELTTHFTNALDVMGSLAAGLSKNNDALQAVSAAQERSFTIREKANAELSSQMQAIALSLAGVNRTVGVVGTTMVDMGGSLEDVNLLLRSLSEKVDRMGNSLSRMETEIKAMKVEIDALVTRSATVIKEPAPVDQSQIKTATLPNTEPLKSKEPSDAKAEEKTEPPPVAG